MRVLSELAVRFLSTRDIQPNWYCIIIFGILLMPIWYELAERANSLVRLYSQLCVKAPWTDRNNYNMNNWTLLIVRQFFTLIFNINTILIWISSIIWLLLVFIHVRIPANLSLLKLNFLIHFLYPVYYLQCWEFFASI